MYMVSTNAKAIFVASIVKRSSTAWIILLMLIVSTQLNPKVNEGNSSRQERPSFIPFPASPATLRLHWVSDDFGVRQTVRLRGNVNLMSDYSDMVVSYITDVQISRSVES